MNLTPKILSVFLIYSNFATPKEKNNWCNNYHEKNETWRFVAVVVKWGHSSIVLLRPVVFSALVILVTVFCIVMYSVKARNTRGNFVRLTFAFFADKDPCRPNPCSHVGICTEIAGGFVCNCSLGFKGATCQGKHEGKFNRGCVTELLILPLNSLQGKVIPIVCKKMKYLASFWCDIERETQGTKATNSL